MSLIRQVWLLVLGIIVFALLGSIASSILTARSYVQTQLALKNSDNAQSLALILSQQGGDRGLMELAISAQFDIGHYRSIRLRDASGAVMVGREAAPFESEVPQWFRQLVVLESVPGVAQVSAGWAPVGSVEVVSQPVFAYADLWRGALRVTGWMLLVGLAAAIVAHLAVRRLRVPLDQTVEQAQALSRRQYMTIVEPSTPELREVSRAMNLLVDRVRVQFDEQAAQVDALRQRANGDPLTGLSHRQHFLTSMHAYLTREESPVDGHLLLIRVLGLSDLNLVQGHLATDAMLKALARLVDAPMAGANPVAAGRLNGTDFAVLFGHGGELKQSSNVLMERVRTCVANFPATGAVMSAVNLRATDTVGALLARADAGLACAEAHGEFAIEIVEQVDPLAQGGGERSWREAIGEALRQGRTKLGQFPVVDRSGHLLHIECPLRLQVRASGEYQVAASWLPHAIRTGLATAVDASAIELALRAIADDRQARCVNVSPRSLGDPTFLSQVVTRLRSHADAARFLWLEVDATTLTPHAPELGEMCRRLRPMGVRVGIEHAGERIATSRAVFEAGLDFIKLSQALSLGVAGDLTRQSLLKGIVSVLHGVGVAAYAEGLQDAADLAACWECGVDGVTGPIV